MSAEHIQIKVTTGVGAATLAHVGEQADHAAFGVVRVVAVGDPFIHFDIKGARKRFLHVEASPTTPTPLRKDARGRPDRG